MITEFEVLKTYSELLNGKYGKPGTVSHHRTCGYIAAGAEMACKPDFMNKFKDELWLWYLQTEDYYYNSLVKNV